MRSGGALTNGKAKAGGGDSHPPHLHSLPFIRLDPGRRGCFHRTHTRRICSGQSPPILEPPWPPQVLPKPSGRTRGLNRTPVCLNRFIVSSPLFLSHLRAIPPLAHSRFPALRPAEWGARDSCTPSAVALSPNCRAGEDRAGCCCGCGCCHCGERAAAGRCGDPSSRAASSSPLPRLASGQDSAGGGKTNGGRWGDGGP